MAENKLEEVIDLLAEYGGFDRNYLKDKLLINSSKEKPDNKNKMEQVAVMDNFDKLLGRNGELIELRKEQVLDGAMCIVQQYYADKQNKMEAVAQLFGKQLGEEFDIKWGVCEYTIRFTKDGMEVTDDYGEWYEAQLYRVLLTGEAVITGDK